MESAKLKVALTAFLALVCAGLIIVGIYPYHPKTYTGWVLLYLISLPIIIISETLGEKLFSVKVSNNLGSKSRIIYGVIIVGLIIFLSILVVPWVEPYFVKWGS